MLDRYIAGRTFSNPEFLAAFFHLYRSLPALWNRSDPDYTNTKKRRDSWDTLLKFTQTRIPDAHLEFVKSKLECVRATFRKEWRRVNKSLKSGVPGDVYKPSLWYYDLLLFTVLTPDQEEVVTVQSNLEEEVDEDNALLNEEERKKARLCETKAIEGAGEEEGISDHALESRPSKRKKPNEEATQYLVQSLEKSIEIQQEDDILSKNFASKLRQMPSSQRDLAHRLILEVLSSAVKNQLTPSTCISNE